MSKKCYLVYSIEDEDGGFGDAVRTTSPIKVFLDKEKAEKYVKENDNLHVYDFPYSELYTGGVDMVELKLDDENSRS